jgi:hypothetical protein
MGANKVGVEQWFVSFDHESLLPPSAFVLVFIFVSPILLSVLATMSPVW